MPKHIVEKNLNGWHYFFELDKGCTSKYFAKLIKPTIESLRSINFEHLVIIASTDNVEFIQTYKRRDGLFRIEIRTTDVRRQMCSLEYELEQVIQTFYDVCVLKKSFEEITDYKKHWYDFLEEECYLEDICDKYKNKNRDTDEDALYIDSLITLLYKYEWNKCGEIIDYYEKAGNDELVEKYKKMQSE